MTSKPELPDQAIIVRAIHALCDLAAIETLRHFRVPVDVINKQVEGFDPVTVADRAAETTIRNYLRQNFPDHGIVGEELAPVNPDADICWIIDPVDGTRAYISGLPSWGTLIGVNYRGTPVAGVMHQPFIGEKYFCDGKVSYLEHREKTVALSTSDIANLSEATLMTTSPELFTGKEAEAFNSVSNACRLTRYGFDCYAYAMVAAGNVELVVENGLKAYDIAPLIPIVEAAGGIVTTWDGGSAAQGGNIIAAANRHVHAMAVELLMSKS